MRLDQPWMHVAKASSKDLASIEAELKRFDRISAKVRKAFLDAVDRVGNTVDLDEVARLLRAGRVQEAIDLVSAPVIATGMLPIAAAVTQATVTVAQETAAGIVAPTGLQVVFGQTNPNAVAALQQHEFDLIRDITSESRRAVHRVVTEGVIAGRNPRTVAREMKASLGLTERQAQAVANYRRALETLNVDAVERALRDKRFDKTVERAIREQTPLSEERIDRMVDRYRERYIAHRAETIARTEAIRALSEGQIMTWQQAVNEGTVEAGDVVKEWIFTHDKRTRDAHRSLPAMNPDGVGLDEAFESELGPIRYPGDPAATAANTINCRCTLFIRYRPRRDKGD